MSTPTQNAAASPGTAGGLPRPTPATAVTASSNVDKVVKIIIMIVALVAAVVVIRSTYFSEEARDSEQLPEISSSVVTEESNQQQAAVNTVTDADPAPPVTDWVLLQLPPLGEEWSETVEVPPGYDLFARQDVSTFRMRYRKYGELDWTLFVPGTTPDYDEAQFQSATADPTNIHRRLQRKQS